MGVCLSCQEEPGRSVRGRAPLRQLGHRINARYVKNEVKPPQLCH